RRVLHPRTPAVGSLPTERRPGSTVAGMERMEADVCVVGAGFAGLAAARMLAQEGLTAVVLEARDRVGGRTHTEVLAGGTTIDHGGAWFGPAQDAAYGLAAEVGVHTYATYSKGASVYVKD